MSVPVLSEHIHEVDPKVSTASKFLTRTCFSESFFAVIASEIVMQAKRPYGTFATNIPIPKIAHYRILYLTTNNANRKNIAPRPNAIQVIIKTNRSSSILRGVFASPPAAAKSAICPIIV